MSIGRRGGMDGGGMDGGGEAGVPLPGTLFCMRSTTKDAKPLSTVWYVVMVPTEEEQVQAHREFPTAIVKENLPSKFLVRYARR